SRSDADHELIRRIRVVKRCDEWQVVSSDNAVAGAARAKGVSVVSAQEFARRLESLDAPKPNASLHEKRNDRPLSKAEIAEWMRLFGVSEEEESEDEGQ
ncbi:MAG: hypothetical protein HGA19_24020, partial [Oscillochloris sp.]|nr:hypothetical protein [Oscillochloris sp.]